MPKFQSDAVSAPISRAELAAIEAKICDWLKTRPNPVAVAVLAMSVGLEMELARSIVKDLLDVGTLVADPQGRVAMANQSATTQPLAGEASTTQAAPAPKAPQASPIQASGQPKMGFTDAQLAYYRNGTVDPACRWQVLEVQLRAMRAEVLPLHPDIYGGPKTGQRVLPDDLFMAMAGQHSQDVAQLELWIHLLQLLGATAPEAV